MGSETHIAIRKRRGDASIPQIANELSPVDALRWDEAQRACPTLAKFALGMISYTLFMGGWRI